MIRDEVDHGFSDGAWEAARAEARKAVIAVASRRRVIAYSDLVAEIRSVDFEAKEERVAHLLGEI